MVLNAVSWNKLKLIDVVDFLDEKRVPLKESERLTKKGIYPYYGASGIIDYVDDYIFDGEFILLGEDGANIITRSTRLAFLAKGKIWVNNHAHVMTTKDGFNNYFICEYLESLDYTKYNTGTAQPKLNKEVCKNILINIPPLREQEKIAEILSTWDLAIDKQQQLIEKKKEFKKGLMQRLLTGEVRFKEFTGEWKTIKLKEIIEESKEKSTKNNQFDILSVTKDGVFLQSEYFKRQVASEDNTGYKIVRKNDLVFSSMNLWMGSIDVLTQFDVGIVSPACKVFKVDLDKVDINYLKEFVRSEKMINLYKINSEQGASIVRRNLDLKGLLNSKICIPNKYEQKKIGELLKNASKEINLLEKELEALKIQKKGLMQRLLTGEVRVNVE